MEEKGASRSVNGAASQYHFGILPQNTTPQRRSSSAPGRLNAPTFRPTAAWFRAA